MTASSMAMPCDREGKCASTQSPSFPKSQQLPLHSSSRHTPLTASSHFTLPYASVLCAITLSPSAFWPRLTMRHRQLPRLALLLAVFALASLLLAARRLHPAKPSVATAPHREARVLVDHSRDGVCGGQRRGLDAPLRLPGYSSAPRRALDESDRPAQADNSLGQSFLASFTSSSADTSAPDKPTSPAPLSTCSKCRTLKEVLDGAVTAAGGDPSAAATVAAALEEEYGGPTAMPDPDRPLADAPPPDPAAADNAGDVKPAGARVAAEAAAEAAASSLSRTVIVTALSEAWAPMMRFFLERLRLVEQQQRAQLEQAVEAGQGEAAAHGLDRLIDRLVVVAYDDASFDLCCSLGLHCYFDWQEDAEEKEDFSGEQKHFMTPAYIHLVWRKVHVVRSMLALGFDVVFTDNDILWLKNPLPHLLLSSTEDMLMSVDTWHANSRAVVANGGFYAARSNVRMLKFFDEWIQWHRRLPKHRIQQIFDWIRPEANPFTRTATPLTVRYLPTDEFGGFCEMGARLAELVTVHATCCFGLDNKLRVLRKIAADWDWMQQLAQSGQQLAHLGQPLEDHGFMWRRRTCLTD